VKRDVSACLLLGLAVAGCDRLPGAKQEQAPAAAAAPQTTVRLAEPVAPGTTPMNQRVAVLGFLNKRNGISRDLTLRPGQAVRVGDAIVRLRACETTPPWEFDPLTGAFVQLDVKQPNEELWDRVFSGWLYKESPSLNVVEHPVYDVWPKSCTMTFPGAAEEAGSLVDDSSPSSESQRGNGPARARASPSNPT
jgi:hypothetical protein